MKRFIYRKSVPYNVFTTSQNLLWLYSSILNVSKRWCQYKRWKNCDDKMNRMNDFSRETSILIHHIYGKSYLLKIICINVFKVLIYEFCWKKYYRLQIEIIRHFIKDFHRSTCKEFIVPPIFFSCYGNKKFELLAANQINLTTIKISFCSISIPVSRKKKNKKN